MPRFVFTVSLMDAVFVVSLAVMVLQMRGESFREVLIGRVRVLKEVWVGIALIPVVFMLVIAVIRCPLTETAPWSIDRRVVPGRKSTGAGLRRAQPALGRASCCSGTPWRCTLDGRDSTSMGMPNTRKRPCALASILQPDQHSASGGVTAHTRGISGRGTAGACTCTCGPGCYVERAKPA